METTIYFGKSDFGTPSSKDGNGQRSQLGAEERPKHRWKHRAEQEKHVQPGIFVAGPMVRKMDD